MFLKQAVDVVVEEEEEPVFAMQINVENAAEDRSAAFPMRAEEEAEAVEVQNLSILTHTHTHTHTHTCTSCFYVLYPLDGAII